MSNGRFTRAELAVVRRAYAKQISSAADIAHPGVEAAFAAVPRERFLGPGPWKVMRWGGPNGGRYVETPGDDPVYVYTNDVIAIDPARRLNNGEPGLHALLMSRLDLRPGQHAVHIGVGAGYYTALLAEQVGPSGRVTAIEFAPDLAALAARNLAHYPWASVRPGDGTTADFDPADGIYVNAGATHPAEIWLERLRPGGRLILPLTADDDPKRSNVRRGAVFLITRQDDGFAAERVSGVAIFPCAGGRNSDAGKALGRAFKKGGVEFVRRLVRGADVAQDRCWWWTESWALAYDEIDAIGSTRSR